MPLPLAAAIALLATATPSLGAALVTLTGIDPNTAAPYVPQQQIDDVAKVIETASILPTELLASATIVTSDADVFDIPQGEATPITFVRLTRNGSQVLNSPPPSQCRLLVVKKEAGPATSSFKLEAGEEWSVDGPTVPDLAVDQTVIYASDGVNDYFRVL